MSISNYLTDPSWKTKLALEFKKDYFKNLESFVDSAYASTTCYPPKNQIFEALNLTPFDNVKAVILGQDPYHGYGQAHGLCFSILKGNKLQPSIVNILKELQSDLNVEAPIHGFLEKWAKEGVLLLNNILTVKEASPMAHQKQGWEVFTDKIIDLINHEKENVVFILWGAPAQKKAKNVDSSKHKILIAPHPSPLSVYRGFYNSKPFSQTNKYLLEHKIKPIDWSLD